EESARDCLLGSFSGLLFWGFISLISAALYPSYFPPQTEGVHKEQATNQSGIVQEDLCHRVKRGASLFGRK
uniref:Uncharacterized protein n=1 Tax=Spermophilus dauricus TaxID=99837 RepID=A0A8C9P8D4_SPEDA